MDEVSALNYNREVVDSAKRTLGSSNGFTHQYCTMPGNRKSFPFSKLLIARAWRARRGTDYTEQTMVSCTPGNRGSVSQLIEAR